MIKTVLAVSMMSLFISSCAFNPTIEYLSEEQKARFPSIEIIKGNTSKKYTKIGKVEGISCLAVKLTGSTATEEEAVQGMKIRAAMLEADAVIEVSCVKSPSTDYANNCWSSIKCSGDAVKFNKP